MTTNRNQSADRPRLSVVGELPPVDDAMAAALGIAGLRGLTERLDWLGDDALHLLWDAAVAQVAVAVERGGVPDAEGLRQAIRIRTILRRLRNGSHPEAEPAMREYVVALGFDDPDKEAATNGDFPLVAKAAEKEVRLRDRMFENAVTRLGMEEWGRRQRERTKAIDRRKATIGRCDDGIQWELEAPPVADLIVEGKPWEEAFLAARAAAKGFPIPATGAMTAYRIGMTSLEENQLLEMLAWHPAMPPPRDASDLAAALNLHERLSGILRGLPPSDATHPSWIAYAASLAMAAGEAAGAARGDLSSLEMEAEDMLRGFLDRHVVPIVESRGYRWPRGRFESDLHLASSARALLPHCGSMLDVARAAGTALRFWDREGSRWTGDLDAWMAALPPSLAAIGVEAIADISQANPPPREGSGDDLLAEFLCGPHPPWETEGPDRFSSMPVMGAPAPGAPASVVSAWLESDPPRPKATLEAVRALKAELGHSWLVVERTVAHEFLLSGMPWIDRLGRDIGERIHGCALDGEVVLQVLRRFDVDEDYVDTTLSAHLMVLPDDRQEADMLRRLCRAARKAGLGQGDVAALHASPRIAPTRACAILSRGAAQHRRIGRVHGGPEILEDAFGNLRTLADAFADSVLFPAMSGDSLTTERCRKATLRVLLDAVGTEGLVRAVGTTRCGALPLRCILEGRPTPRWRACANGTVRFEGHSFTPVGDLRALMAATAWRRDRFGVPCLPAAFETDLPDLVARRVGCMGILSPEGEPIGLAVVERTEEGFATRAVMAGGRTPDEACARAIAQWSEGMLEPGREWRNELWFAGGGRPFGAEWPYPAEGAEAALEEWRGWLPGAIGTMELDELIETTYPTMLTREAFEADG